MIRSRLLIAPLLLLLLTASSPALGQQYAAGEAEARAPRFLLASSSRGATPMLLDVRRTPVLMRRIAVDLDGVPLSDALATIAARAGLTLVYADGVMPAEKRVHLRAEQITVVAALTDVLADVGVDVVFNVRGGATLVPRTALEGVLPAAGTITGRVTEAATGNAVSQAQVSVAGTTLGRTTDQDGRYTIVGVPTGTQTVTVRRLGYDPQSRELMVTDSDAVTADFQLVGATTRLAEIVTTVTGGQRRVELGNAIATIAPDSLMRSAPVTNMNDLLMGRTPGLQVYFTTGTSGSATPIRIRGTNSSTLSNDPIVIIDGIRVESTAGTSGGFGQRPGRLSDISPYELESIDVVKGPSAATLYGTDAANGVIVIRTKRGSAGASTWRFFTEQGSLTPADHFKPLYYSYGTNLSTGVAMRCALTQVAAGVCRQDSLVVWNPLEDPETTPFSPGTRRLYGLQTSGGTPTATYFLSAEHIDEVGFLRMPEVEQERLRQQRGVASLPDDQIRPNWVKLLSLRANVGSSVGRRGHVQMSNGLILNSTAITPDVYFAGAFGRSPPTTNGGWTGLGPRPSEAFAVRNVESSTRYIAALSGDYQPRDWLTARATVGLDWSGMALDALQRNGEGPVATSSGRRQDNRYDVKNWSADASATATRIVGPTLTSRTTVGVQYNRRREFTALTSGVDLVPGATTLSGAATTSASEATTETIVAGSFLEQGIALRERLFVAAALRLDGASAFGDGFTSTVYPKASVSWLAIDGAESAEARYVNTLRLRAAVGASGVQPAAVAALQRDCLSAAIVNGRSVSGATLCQLGNPELKPERQTEIEAGFDSDLLKSRLRTEITLYHRQSADAISLLPLPPSTGSALNLSLPMNLGAVRNRGVEAFISFRALDLSQARLDLSVSGNLNENRLLKLGEGVSVTRTSAHQVGHPLFSIFHNKHTWNDLDGNKIITPDEVTLDSFPSFVGTQRPQQVVTGVATIGLLRETLRLSAMLDYRAKFTLVDFTELNNCVFGTCRAVSDPTAPLERQAAAQARFKTGVGPTLARWGYAYDGRFARLREVSATYTVPSALARRAGAQGADISVSGRNLGLFGAEYPGPSVESSSAAPAVAPDISATNPGSPIAKYWLVRLHLHF